MNISGNNYLTMSGYPYGNYSQGNYSYGNYGYGDTTIKGNPEENSLKANGKGECQTCENRKYQDGSDEMVSFKSPAHISPEAAAGVVRAHEQEHVSNAYKQAELKGGKVMRASVTLKTAICPECGRSYVAGGTTSTHIKYPNENNPYQKAKKSADRASLSGMNMDIAI